MYVQLGKSSTFILLNIFYHIFHHIFNYLSQILMLLIFFQEAEVPQWFVENQTIFFSLSNSHRFMTFIINELEEKNIFSLL